jgi:hypothetical protein
MLVLVLLLLVDICAGVGAYIGVGAYVGVFICFCGDVCVSVSAGVSVGVGIFVSVCVVDDAFRCFRFVIIGTEQIQRFFSTFLVLGNSRGPML